MPNWQTSGEMSEADVDMMARYIQHDPPSPRVRHGGHEEDLEGDRAPKDRPHQEDERLQHRQHLLDHAA